jgi:hypothetical protein
MFAHRLTFRVKTGHVSEVVEMIKSEIAKGGPPSRVYQSYISPSNLVIEDLEFESLAELQAHWAEWFAKPETAAFLERWDELVEGTVTNEVWQIVE